MIKETKDGLIVQFKISPNSSKNEIIKTDEGIKIKITAQPIDGKANKALVEYLSKEFKIPKTYIDIVKGTTNKEKTVLFRTNDLEKVNFIKAKFE
ncbi:YggU family protein [bacterium]|nr:YggU family protein [bacterium]